MRNTDILLDPNSKMILDTRKRSQRWQMYIQAGNTTKRRQLGKRTRYNKRCGIKSNKKTKNNKETRPDQIPIEILKLIEEGHIKILIDLYNIT